MKLLKDLKPSKTPALDIIYIALLCALIAYLDYFWHGLCQFPPTADYAMHFTEAASLHSALQHAQGLSGILTVWIWPSHYPAGMYLIAHIYMIFAGTGIKQILLSQLLLIPFLVSSLYYLARPRLGIAAGITAVLSAAVIPELFINTDHYLVDHGQAVFVLAAMSLLVNFSSFKSRSAAIVLGIAIGFAELVKYTAFIFIIIPFIIAAFTAIRTEKPCRKTICVHASLAAGAFIIPYFTASCMDFSLSADILTGGTIFKAVSLWLAALIILCWVIWNIGIFILRKKSSVLANIAFCSSTAYIMGFPWFICNFETVSARKSALSDIFIRNLSSENLSHWFHECWRLIPNAIFIILLAAAIIFLFTKYSCQEDWMIASAAFPSLIATYSMLGISSRYTEASFVLGMVMIVCFLSRFKLGDLLALALFSLTFVIKVVWPVIVGNETALNIRAANNTLLQNITDYYNCTVPAFRNLKGSGFTTAADIAPLLCLPSLPSLVFIAIDETETDASLQYSKDMCYGLQCWSAMNDCKIVPVLYNFSKNKINVPSEYYLSRLAAHLQKSLPELLSLHGLVVYDDDFNGKLSMDRDHFFIYHGPIDSETNIPLGKFDSQIIRKLGKNAVYEDIAPNGANIRIWKRNASSDEEKQELNSGTALNSH